MKATYIDVTSERRIELDVPASHWQAILSALRPNHLDPRPAEWVTIGELIITRTDGRLLDVDLYSVRDGEGAFSAATSREERRYFRGGKTKKLVDALNASSR